jgi:hypothetical protein
VRVTTTGPAGTLDALLVAERGRVRAALAAAAGLAAVALVLAGAAAAAAALAGGRWLALPALTPALVWLALALGAVAFALGVRPRLRDDAGDEQVARAVEGERALRAGALRAAREVAATGPLGARAADDLARTLHAAGGPLAPAWLARARRLAAGGAFACAGALAAVAAAGAWAGDGLAALVHPVRAARGTLLPPLRVVGAPAHIARGRPLTVAVEAPGRARVTARWRLAGHGWLSARSYPPPTDARRFRSEPSTPTWRSSSTTGGRGRTRCACVWTSGRSSATSPCGRSSRRISGARPRCSRPATCCGCRAGRRSTCAPARPPRSPARRWSGPAGRPRSRRRAAPIGVAPRRWARASRPARRDGGAGRRPTRAAPRPTSRRRSTWSWFPTPRRPWSSPRPRPTPRSTASASCGCGCVRATITAWRASRCV